MKKFLAILLTLCMVLSLAACASTSNKASTETTVESTTEAPTEEATEAPTEEETEAPTEEETEAPTEEETEAPTEEETEAPTEEETEEPTEEETEAAEPMTHAEYAAAELDTEVYVETYVQAHQSWWEDKVTVYAQSEDGAYFIYEMACSEEDAEKLVPGTKIAVKGVKSEWSGEVEIVDATFEFIDGDSYIAEPVDVTELLGSEDLIDHQNEFVSIKGLTVESVAFKNDEPGDDIYVTFEIGELTVEFCVEAYLTGSDTEVYAAVSALNEGDVVDVEGFLYWYNGANTHLTSVTVVTPAPVAETEEATEAPTEEETEEPTEEETEEPTEEETEEPTEEETEEPTEEETEEPTEEETEEPTEEETEEPTEEETEEPTEEETEEPTEEETEEPTEEETEEPTEEETEAAVPMTHAEYIAAELESEVYIETYVQAHQSWWEDKVTVYAQSEDGAYFIYEMACSEEDAEKLVPGTKIAVKGYKSEWSGEVEIIDATFEFIDGDSYIAEPVDVTELLGSEDLADHQNEFVSIKGLTVESVSFKNDEPGDDIYVTFEIGELTAEFCVEAYLTGSDTEVYADVSALNVGDVVDVEGFLYWYNGANTHLTSVTVVTPAPVAETEAEEATEEEAEEPAEEEEDVPGVITKVALVTDVGMIDDESFNQACWEGVVEWCEANGIEYTYYQPTEDSTDARVLSVAQAISEGANVIVMPGYLFGETVLTVQDEYPDVYFIAVDVASGDLTFDYTTYYDPSANVACLTFSEEQAGYLAGYAAVKEGYTKLGFLGGMAVPAVIRYGYGFLQGADAAAAEMGVEVEVNYTYGGQFQGSPEITAKMEGWYQGGTEIVFASGGNIYTSALEAAEKNGGKVIGVDTDQSYISDLIITSAMKSLQNVTETVLEALNNGEWDTYGGKVSNFGLLEGDYVGLPTDSWSLENFTVEEYTAVKEKIQSGEIVVDNSTDAMPELSITVNVIS